MATYYVVWETVAGRGSRAFGTGAEAEAFARELIARGLVNYWMYTSWTE
jgi:hypothetical protein